MDTGTPVLEVPQRAYDAMSGNPTGDLTVNLEGTDGGSVALKFDVQTLIKNQWVQGNGQGTAGGSNAVTLGLPMRAFYYAVMDISDASVSFSPMADYSKKQVQ